MKEIINGDYEAEKEADDYFDNVLFKTKKFLNRQSEQKDYPNHLCTCCETEHHSFNRVVKRHDCK